MNLGDIITHNWKKYKVVEFQNKHIKGFGSYIMVKMQDIEDLEKYIYVNKDILSK